MPIFLLKSILGLIFFSLGIGAALSMLTLMGRQNRKMSAPLLRIMHKTFGFIFLVLFIVLSVICIKYVAMAGDQLPPRAISHSILALALFIILAIKILIVRFYKQLLKFVPVMGLFIFFLAFIVTASSSGFYFLRLATPPSPGIETPLPNTKPLLGSVERGKIIFQDNCSFCHYHDREENKMGPGLKGLLKKETLPLSGKPATIENVRNQIIRPFLTMPSFKSLPEQDMADLLVYIEIL